MLIGRFPPASPAPTMQNICSVSLVLLLMTSLPVPALVSNAVWPDPVAAVNSLVDGKVTASTRLGSLRLLVAKSLVAKSVRRRIGNGCGGNTDRAVLEVGQGQQNSRILPRLKGISLHLDTAPFPGCGGPRGTWRAAGSGAGP